MTVTGWDGLGWAIPDALECSSLMKGTLIISRKEDQILMFDHVNENGDNVLHIV
jgi:hypothetical protein